MEKLPVNTTENEENFHEVFEKRLEIKKLAKELGLDVQALEETKNTPEGRIFDIYYKSDFDELNKKASAFKISDWKPPIDHPWRTQFLFGKRDVQREKILTAT